MRDLWPYTASPFDQFCPVPEPPDPLGFGANACAAAETFFFIPDGRLAGQPVTLMPYQRRSIAAVFGLVDPATRARLTREAFFLLARKNAKTSTLALIALLLLMSEYEPRQRIGIATTTVEQSKLVFNIVVQFLESCAPLMARGPRLREHKNEIEFPAGDSIVVKATAKPGSMHGDNFSAVLADELHAWSTVLGPDRAQKALAALRSSMGARIAPLMITASTMPDDAQALEPGSPFVELLQYARAVAGGTIRNPRFWPCLFTSEEGEDWHSPQLWQRVNPGIAGGILDLEELTAEHDRAINNRALEASFKSLRLNFLPRSSRLSGAWFTRDQVQAHAGEVALTDIAACPRRACGADLAVLDDLSAFVFAGIDTDDRLLARCLAFISRAAFDQHVRDEPVLAEFVEAGELVIHEGEGIDLEQAAADAAELCTAHGIATVALDPAKASPAIATLEAAGLEVVLVRQGALALTPAVITVEQYFARGALVLHGGLLPWCIRNAAVRYVGEAKAITRPAESSSARKIDAAAALLDAVSALLAESAGEASGERRSHAWLEPSIVEALAAGVRFYEDLPSFVDGMIAAASEPDFAIVHSEHMRRRQA